MAWLKHKLGEDVWDALEHHADSWLSRASQSAATCSPYKRFRAKSEFASKFLCHGVSLAGPEGRCCAWEASYAEAAEFPTAGKSWTSWTRKCARGPPGGSGRQLKRRDFGLEKLKAQLQAALLRYSP